MAVGLELSNQILLKTISIKMQVLHLVPFCIAFELDGLGSLGYHSFVRIGFLVV